MAEKTTCSECRAEYGPGVGMVEIFGGDRRRLTADQALIGEMVLGRAFPLARIKTYPHAASIGLRSSDAAPTEVVPEERGRYVQRVEGYACIGNHVRGATLRYRLLVATLGVLFVTMGDDDG